MQKLWAEIGPSNSHHKNGNAALIETFPGKRHDEGGCKTNGVEASISKFPWNFSTVVPWCVRGVTIMHTRMLIDTCGRRGGKGERGRRRLGPGARREISLIMHSFQVAVIILHIAGGGVPTAFANFSSRAKRNGNLAAACACTRVFHSRTTSLEFKHFAGAYGDRVPLRFVIKIARKEIPQDAAGDSCFDVNSTFWRDCRALCFRMAITITRAGVTKEFTYKLSFGFIH